jgi:hypothetical protein
MDSSRETFQTSPPRLIASIVAGFNTVANHVTLIIFPVFLDLLLWFGPHFGIKALFQPRVDVFFDLLAKNKIDMTALAQAIPGFNSQTLLDPINLMDGLRSWPIGIPSLFSYNDKILLNPLGNPTLIEMPSIFTVFAFFILAFLVGIYLGSIYFNAISNASIGLKKSFSIALSLWQFKQSLFLAFLLVFLVLLIAMPVIFIMILFSLFQLALLGFILVSFLLIWILLPLVFSAHGIFLLKLNVITSIATSIRLVRFFLPGTGIFLLVAFIMNFGLDQLWLTTPPDSWLSLIGVAGHAFIASSLLAASFIYYGSGMRWMQENLQHLAARQTQA